MKKQTIQNINLILLYLFVITIIGGAFMIDIELFSVNISAYRILLGVGIIYFLLIRKLVLYRNGLTKYTFYFLLIWIIYAHLSLMWVIDTKEAFRDIYYLLIAFAGFIFFMSIKANTKKFEQKFTLIWTEVFIVVLVFSLREMITATHLVGGFTKSLHQLGPFHSLQYTPVFTFDNPNHFAIYTCLSGIIFIRDLVKGNRIVVNSFLIAACITSLYIFSSRFGMLTVIAVCLILLLRFIFKQNTKELRKIWFSGFKIMVIILFVILSVFTINKQERVFEGLANKTLALRERDALSNDIDVENECSQDFMMSDIDSLGVKRHKISSNKIRINLMKNGLVFFVRSKGMGVGSGNYRAYINQGKNKYQTAGIRSPHNWVIEILSQYGLVIFIGFLGIFFFIFKILKKSIREIKFNDVHLFIILLVVCYGLMSNANSIFITLPLNWLILTMIVSFADDLQEKKS